MPLSCIVEMAVVIGRVSSMSLREEETRTTKEEKPQLREHSR